MPSGDHVDRKGMALSLEVIQAEEPKPRGSYLSPSGAAVWKQCQRRWYMRYVENKPEPPGGEPAVMGNFVHDVLERLTKLPSRKRTVNNTRAIARDVFEELVNQKEWEHLDYDEQGAKKFREKAWAIIEAYYTQTNPKEVDPIEQEMQVDVDLDGVPFRGFVDLVERDPKTGEVVITDYKTGKPPSRGTPWSEKEREEKMLQPLWYAAAVQEMGEHVPAKARLMYFTVKENSSGKYTPITEEISLDLNEEKIQKAKEELSDRWAAMQKVREAGGAPPNTGPLCGWCPFVKECPEGTEEVNKRWNNVNRQGKRGIKEDAPAVEILGLKAK